MKRYLEKNIQTLLWILPFIFILIKNVMLQAYEVGENVYEMNLLQGLITTAPYLILQSAVLMLFYSFSFLIIGYFKYAYIIVLDACITTLMFVDFIYTRTFYGMPTVLWFKMSESSEESGGIDERFYYLLSKTDLWFLVDFILIGILLFIGIKSGWLKKKKERASFRRFGIAMVSSLVVIALIPFTATVFHIGEDTYEELYKTEDTYNQTRYFSSLGYHMMDLYMASNWRAEQDITEDDKQLIERFYAWNQENLPDNAYKGELKGKNIIILQLEAFESFAIGNEIDGQAITPNLNKMLDHSYYFSEVTEQVKGGNSSDCDLLLMTSLLPVDRVSTFNFFPGITLNSMPKILKQNEYSTSYFNSSNASMWNYHDMIKDGMQFDHITMDFKMDEVVNHYISDKSILTQTFDNLVEMDKAEQGPLYAHIVLTSSHMAFQLPEKLQTLKLNKELKNSLMGDYLQAQHYVDEQIGSFVGKLEEQGMLEDTVVVVIGDHGGIHKYYPQSVNELSDEVNYEWYGKANASKVPFIIYNKAITTGKQFDTLCGQVDVMPSLLYLLGVDKAYYEKTALGRNLFNTNRNFVVGVDKTVYGEVTEEEKALLSNMFDISDSLIRGNYFAEGDR